MLDVLIITFALGGLVVLYYVWTDGPSGHFDEHGHPRYGKDLLDLTEEARGDWKDAA